MQLSQTQAAGLYGVSDRTWRRYENGETSIPSNVAHWMRLWEYHDSHVVQLQQKKHLR